MTRGRAVQGERLAWPDATRGLAVIAVVLYHTLIWNHAELAGRLNGGWSLINSALSQMRMPVLLALSGMLAVRALSQGWRGGALQRFVANYWLYLVWVILYFAFYMLVREADLLSGDIGSWSALARQPLLPDTTLWYVLALAVFPLLIVGARAARIPPWAVVVVALAMRACGQLVDMPDSVGKLLRTFVFFALGVYLAPRLRGWAFLGWAPAAGLLAGFVVLVLLAREVPPGVPFAAATTAASLLSIPAAIAVVARVCEWRPAAVAGSWIGSRTLPIYLLHVPLLVLVLMWARRSDSVRSFAQSAAGDIVMPLVVVAVVVAVCVAVGSALRRVPGNVLLAAPGALQRRVGSSSGSAQTAR